MAPRAGEELRRAILDVSRSLGQEHGTEGLTMRAVARKLGVSATVLYQCFDGKGDILSCLRVEALEDLLGRMGQALTEHEDPRAALLAATACYIQWGRDGPWRYAILTEGTALFAEDLNEEMRARFEVAQSELVTKALHTAAGRIPDDPGLQRQVLARWWAWMHGTTALVLSGRLRPEHPAVPVIDLDAFLADTGDAIVDCLFAARG